MNVLRSICSRISQYEWLILLFLFPIIIFLERESAFLLAAFPVLWLVRWVGNGRLFPPTPINWPLFILLFMGVVSLLVTFDMDNSLPMVGGLILGISLYFALVSYVGRSQKRLNLALAGFLIAGVGIMFFGLLHPTFLDRLTIFQPLANVIPVRLVQFPGDLDGFNANRISGTLLWVVPLIWVLAVVKLGEFVTARSGWVSASLGAIFLGLALLMSLTLMFLFSRASQASLLITLSLLAGILTWKHRWFALVIIVTVLLGGGLLIASEETQIRVQQLFLTISGETTGGSTAVESLSGRAEIWERAYYTVRDFPITGTGMNNFPAVMLTYFPPIAFNNTSDITHAHNQLLIVGTDLGFPGMIAYAALMIGIAWMLWKSWRQATKLADKMLALGFAASLLAFELFGLFDGIGLGEKPAIFFWFLLGLSGSLYTLIQQPTLSKSAILTK